MLFALLTVSVAWAEDNQSTVYVKVTDASQLQADKNYILVNETNNAILSNQAVNNNRALGLADGIVSIDNSMVDIKNLTNVGILTLTQSSDNWTIAVTIDGVKKYIGLTSQSSGYIKLYDAVSAEYIKWNLIQKNGAFVFTNVGNNAKTLSYDSSKKYFYCPSSNQKDAYLYVQTTELPKPSLVVSKNTLDLGTEPSESFTVNGEYLSENVTVAIKDASDEGFIVKPTTISLDNGSISNVDVMVLYRGTSSNANATITLTSGDLTQEVAVTASAPELFTTAGDYFVKNKGNNKYVEINGTTDAAASIANKDNADIITLDFDANGVVSTMKNYEGDGDLIATLETVKTVLKNKLASQNLNSDFVDDMFKIKLIKTGDDEGSMYFCFDIPYIEDIDNIRTYLLGQGINNQLVKDYLDLLLQPGKRIYLCANDENGTFSFTQDKTASTSKWMVEEYVKVEDELFTTAGNYYVINEGNGKYVVINGTTDAAATAANKDAANIITLDFDANGIVSTMKNFKGDGNLIETLETVKTVLKNKLASQNLNSDFVDNMFKIKLVMTDDNDGSIYFCFDIPKIRNIDEIRNYLLNEGINNQLVKDYLDILLQPRKRIYLNIADENGTFSFTQDKTASTSKWLLEQAKVTPEGDILFTTPGFYTINNKKTSKYVKLVNESLATVTASKDEADIIDLDFNKNGEINVMYEYNGTGDMISTLASIKNQILDVAGDDYSDFINQMFTMRMIYTSDHDGSVYLCIDVPELDNFNDLRNSILAELGGNAAIYYYLTRINPGNRHYLCVDSDDKTFSLTLDNGERSKWMVEQAELPLPEGELFTTPGSYYIQNKDSEKYVRLVNETLADVTAENQDQADIITLDFAEDGVITEMKQFRGDGDMIATLNQIKNYFKETLIDEDLPTFFLDQMFSMRMVNTGDGDGSVYLCVDVPKIPDFENIRTVLLSEYGGNRAISFYLSHMQPGNRHYLCADSDDSFGFTLNNGNASKWMVTKLEVIPIDEEHFPDPIFRQFVQEKFDKNGNWWLSQAELDLIKTIELNAVESPNNTNTGYNQIKSLKGIEYFTELETLKLVGQNSENRMQVENLDLTKNLKLKQLYCDYGALSELHVNGLSNLNYLKCDYNNLTNLDITGCTSLGNLLASHNSLTSFDSSPAGTTLTYMDISYNELTAVDVASNTALKHFNCSNNMGITEIDITNNEALTYINFQFTGISELDVTHNPWIQVYNFTGCVNLKNTTLDFSNSQAITSLFIPDKAEVLVLGLSGKTTLESINVNRSRFEDDVLDLTGCTNLKKLHTFDCYLKQVKLDGCPNITELNIYGNQLRDLDLKDVNLPYTYGYYTNSGTTANPQAYLFHTSDNSQAETSVKPDVTLIYIDRNKTPIEFTYVVYLRLDNTQSEDSEGSLYKSLLEVGPTDWNYKRVKQWIRLDYPTESEDNDLIVTNNKIEYIKGQKTLSTMGLRDLPEDWAWDSNEVPGEILSLGFYTVPQGAEAQEVSGEVAYVYDIKNDEVTSMDDTYNGDKLSSISQRTEYFRDLDPDLAPFEIKWSTTLSDNPDDVVTGLYNLDLNKEVSKVTYVNLMGVESDRPFEGVNIVVTRYTDGTVSTYKVIK